MEMLNNLWVALTTENEVLINIFSIPLLLIENIVNMLLFTTILNIESNNKNKICYVLFATTLGALCTFFIPKPYSNIITLSVMPFAIMFFFTVKFLKALFAEFIPVVCITILEILLARLFLLLFGTGYEVCANIPICRLFINSTIYLTVFLIYKLAKHFHFNIAILDSISKKNKRILLVNTIFAIIVLFTQIYLIVFYNDKLPSHIILINILSLFAYFAISIFSMVKTMNLEKTTADLEKEKTYNKTLQILHDNMRAFKHDFSNIISGIGGYIDTNDMKGLKKYYQQLLQDCNHVNNLSLLSPDTINNPAVYSVLANKYYKADSLGIKITLDSFIDFNNLHMEIYEFTRILGILMDNAIEAASECDEKIINVMIRNDARQNRQLLVIENTYKDKNIDIDKIYEKGFSTKPENTGLGLWEIERILKKHKNVTRFTTTNNNLFKQQIEIYNE